MSIYRHISGERVFHALQEYPAGLSKQDLARTTGLSVNQVTVGIMWARDIAAAEHLSPITWTRAHGYQAAPGIDIVDAYVHTQLHMKLVALTRLMRGTVAPQAVLTPDDELIRRAEHLITATCDSLELLTAHT